MLRKLLFILLVLAAIPVIGQTKYRRAIFLHHSVGEYIWNDVPAALLSYGNGVSMVEQYFPDPADINDNNWYRWQRIFAGNDPYGITMNAMYSGYPVIVVKTCYISQENMVSADSVAAYKNHYRAIIKVMAKHPNNFFVIWTNYPAFYNSSNTSLWSLQFSAWVKDVLAAGKDPTFGVFPKNVYVFDVFRLLADNATGLLPQKYVIGGTYEDDHPSSAAIAIVAPAFVKATFDAAIAYEKTVGITTPDPMLFNFKLDQNYPNPFNPTTIIQYTIRNGEYGRLTVINTLGQLVFETPYEYQTIGMHTIVFDGSKLSSGTYIYTLQTESSQTSKRMVILK